MDKINLVGQTWAKFSNLDMGSKLVCLYKLIKVKDTSLLLCVIYYSRKKFYDTGPWLKVQGAHMY
jgi:hypothetical protein